MFTPSPRGSAPLRPGTRCARHRWSPGRRSPGVPWKLCVRAGARGSGGVSVPPAGTGKATSWRRGESWGYSGRGSEREVTGLVAIQADPACGAGIKGFDVGRRQRCSSSSIRDRISCDSDAHLGRGEGLAVLLVAAILPVLLLTFPSAIPDPLASARRSNCQVLTHNLSHNAPLCS